jgi:hypothetical protein
MRDYYFDTVENVVRLFLPDFTVYRNENLMFMLENLKNSLTGKVHMPHSYLINKGIHAVTIEATFSKQIASKEVEKNQVQKIRETLGMMERMVRSYDQLDE